MPLRFAVVDEALSAAPEVVATQSDLLFLAAEFNVIRRDLNAWRELATHEAPATSAYVQAVDRHLGRLLEAHEVFPRRANIEFVRVNGRADATMRVWERGSGETLACGTGACAVLVAGVLTGRLDRRATVHLRGGDLEIEWSAADNHVYKTGPATEVFTGEWPDAG